MSPPSPPTPTPLSDQPPTASTNADVPTEPRRELTFRAVATAMVVAVLIGASYPYVVLKIGYGPNISVVSAFFGFLALSVIAMFTGIRGTRWENNLIQTAGTAAGEMGFMCILLAAIDMLNAKNLPGFHLELSSWQIFAWLSTAGLLGVLLAVPLRRHYIDEENLTFADGTAAGETMMVLDLDKKQATSRVSALMGGLGLSGLLAFLRDGPWKLIPGEFAFPYWKQAEALRMGSEVSLLSFGGGLLVGLRISLSMALGMVLAWVIAPGMLESRHIVPEQTFKEVLRWVMWPATGMLVAGGLTALALKWRVIAKTFTNFSAKDVTGAQEEFPLKWVAIGIVICTIALCAVQKISLDFPIWMTLVSLLLSVPLLLVGTRVLGETNWAPISSMANLMQAVFALIAPGSMTANMIGSGMSGTVASNGEHLMQDYKAGKIVGANYRHLTTVQLLAVPFGAAAVAVAYPALVAAHPFGAKGGLSSPASVRWAGFAELLNQGFDALPKGCFAALVVALVAGVVITVLEPKYHKFVPSPTGMGLGMLIPGYAVVPMVLGGIVQFAWQKMNAKNEETYNTPLASGFIAGEALVVLAFSVQAMLAPHWPGVVTFFRHLFHLG